MHPCTYSPTFLTADAGRYISPQAPSEGRCWHADHKLAVRDGGGECGVENMQTLCVACHQHKTGEEAQARRGVKRRNRKADVEVVVEGPRKVRARS